MATGGVTIHSEFVRHCIKSGPHVDKFTNIVRKLTMSDHLNFNEKEHALCRIQIQRSQILHACRVLEVLESHLLGKPVRIIETPRVNGASNPHCLKNVHSIGPRCPTKCWNWHSSFGLDHRFDGTRNSNFDFQSWGIIKQNSSPCT